MIPVKSRPEIPLFILSAIGLVGVILLTLNHLPVPDVLNTVSVASLVGGGAIALPRNNA